MKTFSLAFCGIPRSKVLLSKQTKMEMQLEKSQRRVQRDARGQEVI